MVIVKNIEDFAKTDKEEDYLLVDSVYLNSNFDPELFIVFKKADTVKFKNCKITCLNLLSSIECKTIIFEGCEFGILFELNKSDYLEKLFVYSCKIPRIKIRSNVNIDLIEIDDSTCFNIEIQSCLKLNDIKFINLKSNNVFIEKVSADLDLHIEKCNELKILRIYNTNVDKVVITECNDLLEVDLKNTISINEINIKNTKIDRFYLTDKVGLKSFYNVNTSLSKRGVNTVGDLIIDSSRDENSLLNGIYLAKISGIF